MAERTREPVQLALALGHSASMAREDFVVSPANAEALAMIERWRDDWPVRTLALVGPRGSGKSHLAAIWAARSGARTVAAAELDEKAVPAVLAGGAAVVEDLAEGTLNERALFHLLNFAQQQRAYILLTAESAPGSLALRVADLASRLRAVPVVALAAPDDALLQAVLVKLFADRQLTVDEALLVYLERRIERSIAAARRVVEVLDRESLRRRRPLTRALAADVLGAQASPSGGESVTRSS
ncbi:MAG: chromosomal replication initiator DnaA [Xanthobacteraceae bacterium]